MKIHDKIHIVASGDAGYALSNAYDCNVYLLDGGSELALIDTGAGIAPETLICSIQAEGFDPANIKHVLLTHGHADHSGGAYFNHKYCGAQVMGGALTAE